MADEDNVGSVTDDSDVLSAPISSQNSLQDIISAAKQIRAASGMDADRANMEEEQAKRDALASRGEEEQIAASRDLATANRDLQSFEGAAAANRPSSNAQAPSYQPLNMEDIQGNIFPLLVMATIAGSGQRRHAMGALSAFGAMLEGASEGKKEQYAAAKSKYEADMANMKNTQEEYDKQVAAIRNNKKLSIQERQDKINFLKMELGHKINDEDRGIAGYQRQIDADQGTQKLIQDLYKSQATLQQKINAQAKKTEGQEMLSPKGVQLAEHMLALNVPIPGGVSVKGVARGNSIINDMVERYGIDGAIQMITGGRSNLSADRKSLDFLQPRADAIDLSMGKIKRHIDVLNKVMETGAAGGVKLTNRPLNVLKRELTTNEEFGAYSIAVRIVAMEYETLITNGVLSRAQLHAGAQADADKLINGDMTPEEVRAKISIMLQEMRDTQISTKESLNAVKLRISNDALAPGGITDPTRQQSAPGQPDAAEAIPLDLYLHQRGH
jgi:hypothetical protein